MLATHVLPRLLAHVLAIASPRKLYLNVSLRAQTLQHYVVLISIDLLDHAFAHCPRFLTTVG